MKEGTAGDPFDDDFDELDEDTDDDADDERESDVAEQSNTGETDATTDASAKVESAEIETDDISEADAGNDDVPWAVERPSVKAERDMVQFYLQQSTLAKEEAFQREVAETAGYTPYVTDLREAAYLAAMQHPDEVADVLNDWGCEYV
ncbi:hypothetical protein [Halomicrobium urmianum]|uniref:hypothetical protein n=1 Tax=Halomicrobium urmianum TaxID=1586233 RepID=UPI001CD9685D|nr:hypothetical protein [Halomicrobium urmianum]